MNVIFLSIGQLLGQYSFVIKKLMYRWFCMCSLLYLATIRAWKLWKPRYVMIYVFWLFSNLGWRRHLVNLFRYYRGIVNFCVRWCVIGLVVYYAYNSFNFDLYCSSIFNLFTNPTLSEKGYLGYTVFISCSIVWGILILGALCFKSFRALIKPYWERIVVVNLVVLVILLSLFAKVARAKFGIRVWYPNERIYSHRLGVEFWDSDWWRNIW